MKEKQTLLSSRDYGGEIVPYILKTIGKTANVPTRHFQCDYPSDLPTIDTYLAPMGSTCYVISTGDIYYLNSKGQWIKRNVSSGGGGGSDHPGIWDGGDIDDTGGETTSDTWDGGSINGSDPY